MAKYVCPICGYVYDETAGNPDGGVAPGTNWEDLPEDWVCPLCSAPKAMFTRQPSGEESAPETERTPGPPSPRPSASEEDDLRELSFDELSALCSNLGKGCEKQYLPEEAELFFQLAAYYDKRRPSAETSTFSQLAAQTEADLIREYPAAKQTASELADRGALRALVWSEKTSRILVSLLKKYETKGDAMLENTNVYVCEICGFIYVGDTPPEICPVCKVPSLKLRRVEKEAI
jgi:rubredoxin